MLKLYTKNNCPNCKHVKLLMNKYNVDYICVGIDNLSPGVRQALISEFEALSIFTIPVLETDSDFIPLEPLTAETIIKSYSNINKGDIL